MKKRIKRAMQLERLTPELIVALTARERGEMVSHEAIYQWIWEMKRSHMKENLPYKNLYRYLKHRRRRQKRGRLRDRRGIIPNKVSIEKRTRVVGKRKRIGDVEIDLMMGCNHRSALLVITDRATIKTKLRKLAGRNSSVVAHKIIGALKPYIHTRGKIRTLTFDNDMAFADHQRIVNIPDQGKWMK